MCVGPGTTNKWQVPWAVVNWELTAARTVLRTMVSLFREAEEEPETCKKDT